MDGSSNIDCDSDEGVDLLSYRSKCLYEWVVFSGLFIVGGIDISLQLFKVIYFLHTIGVRSAHLGGIKWGARLELRKIFHYNFQKNSGKNKTPSPRIGWRPVRTNMASLHEIKSGLQHRFQC